MSNTKTPVQLFRAILNSQRLGRPKACRLGKIGISTPAASGKERPSIRAWQSWSQNVMLSEESQARRLHIVWFDVHEFLEKTKHISGCLESEVGVEINYKWNEETLGRGGSIPKLDCVTLHNCINSLKTYQSVHLKWVNFNVWKWYFNRASKNKW